MLLTTYKVAPPGLATLCLFLIFIICLQQGAFAKSIQHEPGALKESGGRASASTLGRGHKHKDNHGQSHAFQGHEDSMEDYDDASWADDDDIEDYDYWCDDENDLIFNPLCRFNDYPNQGKELDGRRFGLSKRRLRFNKRRLRFIKKRHPEHSGIKSRMTVDDLYARDSRKPRLRFVKRDLSKREAQQAQTGKTVDKTQVEYHSRKRRSISGLGQDLSLDKRTTSILAPIKALGDMVLAHEYQRRKQEMEDLKNRLLRAGKRSEPTLKTSGMNDPVLSQAFTDLFKSLLTPSR